MCSLVGLRGGWRAWRTNFNTSLSWVLIEEKELNKVQNLDISDIDESTQPPTTSTKDTSAQYFPRFILVESKEENKPVTSLSPFVIQKVIQSIAGEPENKETTQVESAAHLGIQESPCRESSTCTDFSRLESLGVPSYFAELLKGGNSLPRIGELQRGGDSRRHKISRSTCNKTIQLNETES